MDDVRTGNKDPVYRSLDELVSFIRNNKILSWCFAFLLGIVYRYGFGIAKDVIWKNRNLSFITELIEPLSESQLLFFGIAFNLLVDFTSVLLPALICGALLIYVFNKRAFLFSAGTVAAFLALRSMLWNFWKYPDIGAQISAFISPILAAFILIASVWLLLKIRHRLKIATTDVE